MSIYTRTGDKGTTSLFGGKRLLKSDIQVEAYGSVDELTSFIGPVITKIKEKKQKDFLIDIQKDLYEIMSVMSGTNRDLKKIDEKVIEFEKEIDKIEKKLPELTHFIIPGGNEISSWFHILRTVCRRAERNMVHFFKQSTINNEQLTILKYLNRLSDLFFIFARYYAKGKETQV